MESPSRRSFPGDTPHGASRGRAVEGGAGATGAGVALEQDLTRARPPGGDAAASRIASFAVAVVFRRVRGVRRRARGRRVRGRRRLDLHPRLDGHAGRDRHARGHVHVHLGRDAGRGPLHPPVRAARLGEGGAPHAAVRVLRRCLADSAHARGRHVQRRRGRAAARRGVRRGGPRAVHLRLGERRARPLPAGWHRVQRRRRRRVPDARAGGALPGEVRRRRRRRRDERRDRPLEAGRSDALHVRAGVRAGLLVAAARAQDGGQDCLLVRRLGAAGRVRLPRAHARARDGGVSGKSRRRPGVREGEDTSDSDDERTVEPTLPPRAHQARVARPAAPAAVRGCGGGRCRKRRVRRRAGRRVACDVRLRHLQPHVCDARGLGPRGRDVQPVPDGARGGAQVRLVHGDRDGRRRTLEV